MAGRPRKTYPPEQLEWLRKFFHLWTREDLTARFNARFRTELTAGQMKCLMRAHGLLYRAHSPPLSITDDELAWLRAGYRRWHIPELTARFNAEFAHRCTRRQIAGILNRHRIRSGRKTNTGMGQRHNRYWMPGGAHLPELVEALMGQLERLGDERQTPEALAREIARGRAITDIYRTLTLVGQTYSDSVHYGLAREPTWHG